MADWIVQLAVKKLLATVVSYLKNQYKMEAKTKSALRKLEYTLLPIRVTLEKAEKMELNLDENPCLREWLLKLENAVKEAQDVLDDMECDKLQHQVSERDAASSGFNIKLINFFKVHRSGCSTSLFKYKCIKLGKMLLLLDPALDKLTTAIDNLTQLSNNIIVLIDAMNTSSLLPGGYSNSTTNNRAVGLDLTVGRVIRRSSTVNVVIGRDRDRLEVLKLLNESGGDMQGSDRLSALTISGMGGVGKTTLAQLVYNDKSINFEVKMWVRVSSDNDKMEVIIQKALASATIKPRNAYTTILQGGLKNIVKSKKCLVVLDDVCDGLSNQNSQQWKNFISVLANHAKEGSKIIITSRIQSIAEVVLQGLAIENKLFILRTLDNKSMSLLFKHASVGAHLSNQNLLKPVGGGLPLASMGGLLSANSEYNYWDSISRENILNLGQGMVDAHKLSCQCPPSNITLNYAEHCTEAQWEGITRRHNTTGKMAQSKVDGFTANNVPCRMLCDQKYSTMGHGYRSSGNGYGYKECARTPIESASEVATESTDDIEEIIPCSPKDVQCIQQRLRSSLLIQEDRSYGNMKDISIELVNVLTKLSANLEAWKSESHRTKPEDIFAALQEIEGLEEEDLLKAYSALTCDDRMFNSLMALPREMRKKWILLKIKE